MQSVRVASAFLRRALFLAVIPSLWAFDTDSDARARQLISRFVAPCCWRENLSSHYSPQAEALRAEIRTRVAAGESGERIQRDLTGRYTSRILAEPEGVSGRWLSWTPWIFLLNGAFGVSWIVWRSSRRLTPESGDQPVLDLPDTDWDGDIHD